MTGSLQVKSDKFYAVLNFKNQEGKRVQKWICLNLPVRGNKRKAEAMLREATIHTNELVSASGTAGPLSRLGIH